MRRDLWKDKAGGRQLPVKQYYRCVRWLVGGRWNSDNNTSIITKVFVFESFSLLYAFLSVHKEKLVFVYLFVYLIRLTRFSSISWTLTWYFKLIRFWEIPHNGDLTHNGAMLPCRGQYKEWFRKRTRLHRNCGLADRCSPRYWSFWKCSSKISLFHLWFQSRCFNYESKNIPFVVWKSHACTSL